MLRFTEKVCGESTILKPTVEDAMEVETPEKVTLHVRPHGALSRYYNFTLGKEYCVLGRMGSLLVVETDDAGVTASVSPSYFVPKRA